MWSNKVVKFEKKYLAFFISIACTQVYAAQNTVTETDDKKVNDEESVPFNSRKEEIEKIVVYGRKQADILAINAKRDAKNILEAISQDELGRLPDNNLGETLGRVSGVSTVLDEGVGRYVSIRGLKPEFVNVTVDGSGLASAARTFDENGGRATNLEALDPDFIGKIEVYKSVSADMDGDAIGGAVNFVSRTAFDLKENQDHFTVISASVGANSMDEIPYSENDTNTKLKISHIHKFGDDDQFGLVVTASQKDENKDIIKKGIHYWNGSLTPSGAPYDGLVFEEKKKTGGSVKFEYQPSMDFYGFISAIYSDEESSWDKNEHIVWGGLNPEQGTITDSLALLQHKDSYFGTDGTTLSSGINWTVNDSNELQVRISTSQSESFLEEDRIQWQGQSLNGSLTSNGRKFDYLLDPISNALFGDKTQYRIGDARYKNNKAEQSEDSFRFDWANNDDGANGNWGYKVGSKYKSKEYNFTELFARYQNYQGDDQFHDLISSYAYQSPSSNTNLLYADVNAISNRVGGFNDFLTGGDFNRVRDFYDNARDFDSEEEVTAAYGLVSYFTENLDARIGVRFERTKYIGTNRKGSVQDAEVETNTGKYNDILPSASVNYRIGDDIQLRAAYSETLGRPNMDQYVFVQTDPNLNTGVYFVNPGDLNPRGSSNIDLAAEYYFDNGASLLSFGYFSKDIDNEIVTIQVPYQYQIDDITTIDSYYLLATNAGEGKVDGIELSFVKTRFDFLPSYLSGFGLNINATIQQGELEQDGDTNGTVRKLDKMPNAPERIYNIALTYDTKNLNARLAWQYSSERLLSIGSEGSPDYDLVRQATERLDFNIGYDITPFINASIEVFNLTDEEIDDQGYNYWDETTQYGRSVWLSAKVRF